MRFHFNTMPRILGLAGIAALVVAAVPATASAAPTESGGNHICTGTSASPGTLAGNFANVTITGTCLVDAGNVKIAGNLTVADGASLVADRSGVAGVRFFYPAHDGTTIAAVRFDPAGLPAETDLTGALAEPGDVMSPPPKGTLSGRVAFATVLAGTAAACRAALDAAQAALIIEDG